MLNSDFNYKHYGQFYEQIEKKEEEKDDRKGVERIVNEHNLLTKMWNKVQLDPAMTENYEQWLEEEVWTYFD